MHQTPTLKSKGSNPFGQGLNRVEFGEWSCFSLQTEKTVCMIFIRADGEFFFFFSPPALFLPNQKSSRRADFLALFQKILPHKYIYTIKRYSILL